MLLQACLGLHIDGRRREIHIDRPVLPPGIDCLAIERLRIGDDQAGLVFERRGDRVEVGSSGAFPDAVRILVRV